MTDELNVAGENPELRQIMTIKQSNEMDLEYAKRVDYYKVVLYNEVLMVPIHIKTPAWVLDENRRPVIVDGKRVRRSPTDAGLDVWAANGPEEYTLMTVELGAKVVATVETISLEIRLKNSAPKE